MKSYLFRYEHKGQSWPIAIKVESEEDICTPTPQMLLGETAVIIPVTIGLWTTQLFCW